jgi:ankyrin repeat protein
MNGTNIVNRRTRIMFRVFIVMLAVIPLAACAPQKSQSIFDLAKNGDLKAIKSAIKKGIDVNARDSSGATALMYAAGYNADPKVVSEFLSAGASLRDRDGSAGRTALMWATQYNGNPEVLAAILAAGGDKDLELRDTNPAYGWTALMWAANSNKNPAIITTLVEAGADVKAKGKNGFTPLMAAAEYSDTPSKRRRRSGRAGSRRFYSADAGRRQDA